MNRFYTIFFILYGCYLSWHIIRKIAENITIIDYILIVITVFITIIFCIFILKKSSKYKRLKSTNKNP